METPNVCIVTPVHGDWPATRRYLLSARELTYPNLEIIIVDDGSTDDSVRRIQEEFPEAIVITGDGDLWWAAATNLGAREAISRGARFIFTCNNDVVLDRNVISASVACSMEAGNGVVGATVLYQGDPQRVWFAGAVFDPSSGEIAHNTESWPATDGPRPVSILTGMGMLIPVEVYQELGGFDATSFPHYLADCDLSLRAAAQGYQLLVSPASCIYNDVSSAWSVREFERGRLAFLGEMLVSKRSAFWVVGRVRFYRRHWGPGWIRALGRLYLTWFRTYAAPLVKRRFLSLVNRRVVK